MIDRKVRILLVDDDIMNGELLKKRLDKRENFDCTYVKSPLECLQIFDKQDFDIVLLDIVMPEMSGNDVLKEIRKTKNSFELPIIMVTAKDEASDVIASLKNGANDYITKPINMDIAIARMNTQLQIKTLFQESLKNKQISTINTMVTTLNHEINNPLAIAIGNLTISKAKLDEVRIDKALSALDRITEIVKKIEKITSGDMEEVNYSTKVNMFKIE